MKTIENDEKVFEEVNDFDKTVKELERIVDDAKEGYDVSYGDLVFLTEHQELVKSTFPDDAFAWEFAGIPEEEWNNK